MAEETATEPAPAPVPAEEKEDDKASEGFGTRNRIVTQEEKDQLFNELDDLMGELHAGVDPRLFSIGAELAVFYLEGGVREFGSFAGMMIKELNANRSGLGDRLAPYLRNFYNGARDWPDTDYTSQMSSIEEVNAWYEAHKETRIESEQEENSRQWVDQAIEAAATPDDLTKIKNGMVYSMLSERAKGESDLAMAEKLDAMLKEDRDVEPQRGKGQAEPRPARPDGGGAVAPGEPDVGRGTEGAGPVLPDAESQRGEGRGDMDAVDRERDEGAPGGGAGARRPVAEGEGELPRGASLIKSDYTLPEVLDLKGPKARFQANLEAIRTLKAIESGSELATEANKEKLSQFVGWGGLKQVFDYRDEGITVREDQRWTAERDQLRDAMSSEEYVAARASVREGLWLPVRTWRQPDPRNLDSRALIEIALPPGGAVGGPQLDRAGWIADGTHSDPAFDLRLSLAWLWDKVKASNGGNRVYATRPRVERTR